MPERRLIARGGRVTYGPYGAYGGYGTRLAMLALHGIEGRADLKEELLLGVGLRDESAEALGEHPLELVLLCKTAAQDDRDLGIDLAELIEDLRAIHDGHGEIKDHQFDLALELLIDVESLEAVPGGDDPVALVRENALGQEGDEI